MQFSTLLSLALLAVVSQAVAQADMPKRTSPDYPTVDVPAVRYESAFADYRPAKGEPPLPWKQLFDADGSLIAEDELNRASTAATPTGRAAPQANESANAKHSAHRSDAVSPATASGTSDARARVEWINKADNRIKLKHGPIAKFDMPGMTMVFRVNDPGLLDQLEEGDEIDVTIDKVDGAFVVTGIQKRGSR